MTSEQTPFKGQAWTVRLVSYGGGRTLPGAPLRLEQVSTDGSPADVLIETRFEDAGLTSLVPRELVINVTCVAEGHDEALANAGAVAGGLVTFMAFAVNGYISPPFPILAFESTQGLSERRFWASEHVPDAGLPRIGRPIKTDHLEELLVAFAESPESARIGRAIAQYGVALERWTWSGYPVAMAHLYMAIEALGPAVERVKRAERGFDSDHEHAVAYGIDILRSNWREVLLGSIRREVICDGDRAVYDAARRASDGFEHGSMDLQQYKDHATRIAEKLVAYSRSAIVTLLNIPEPFASEIANLHPMDVTPPTHVTSGVMRGEVAKSDSLGYPAGYPEFRWKSELRDYQESEDGQGRFAPQVKVEPIIRRGITVTHEQYGISLGFGSDKSIVYEPGSEEPTVTHDGESRKGGDEAAG